MRRDRPGLEVIMGQVRYDQIVPDPEIMLGKPTIKGTRITVELILEELAQ